MKKKFLKKVISLGLSAVVLGVTVPVSASTLEGEKFSVESNCESNYDEVKDYLKENGVSEEKIEGLIEKLVNNEVWDCYKSENLKSVPKEFYELNTDGKDQEKYYRFSDGSFIEVSIERNKDDLKQLNKIKTSGMKNYSSGTQYTDYKIRKRNGMYEASFYVDCWRARSGYGPSKITRAYQPSVSGFNCAGLPTVSIDRGTEDLNYGAPAIASMSFQLSASIGAGVSGISGTVPVGTTVIYSLKLRNGNMTITDNIFNY